MKEYSIAVIGEKKVGKTALILRYLSGQFSEAYEPTFDDSFHKKIRLESKPCNIAVIDSSLLESPQNNLLNEAMGLLLVYDVTSRDSIQYLHDFVQRRQRTIRSREVPCVLVGNKLDLAADRREVEKAQGADFGRSVGAFAFTETSAKTGEKVDRVLNTLFGRIREFEKSKHDTCYRCY